MSSTNLKNANGFTNEADTPESGVKQTTLNQRSAKIIARLNSAENIQTAKGLRNLRNDANAVLVELQSVRDAEQKLANEGDKIDQEASAEEIVAIEKKISTIQTILPTLVNQVDRIKSRKTESNAD